MPSRYPITDFNNLNIDWVISQLREVTDKTDLTEAGLSAEIQDRENGDAELRSMIEALDPTIAGALYPLTPQMYGAKADGVTDDTLSIQACIDAAHDQGRPVFFPRANYFVNTILFNDADVHTSHALRVYSGQSILGDNAVITTGDQVNHTIYTYNAPSAGAYGGAADILIAGFTFIRSAYANASTMLNLSHSDRITIRRCEFEGSTAWHQIEVNSSRSVTIADCVFRAMYGVILASTECIQFDAATGGGNLGLSDGTACVDCHITGCTFQDIENCAIGSHSSSTVTNLTISGCTFKAAADFARPFISFDQTVQILVVGCYFEGVSNQATVGAKFAFTTDCVYDHAFPADTASTGPSYDIVNNFMTTSGGNFNTDFSDRLADLFAGSINLAPAAGSQQNAPDTNPGVVMTGKPVNNYTVQAFLNTYGRLFLKGIHNGGASNWKEAVTIYPLELTTLNQHNSIPSPGVIGAFFLPTATGSPTSSDSGFFFEIRNAGSGNYGCEFAVTNHNFYVRGYNNGTYSSWHTIATY